MRWVLVSLCVVLVACGGGNGSSTDAQTPEQIARRECPVPSRDACVAQVVQFADGRRPAALCVNGDQWYIETPQGAVGERCSQGGTIKAIVGGS